MAKNLPRSWHHSQETWDPKLKIFSHCRFEDMPSLLRVWTALYLNQERSYAVGKTSEICLILAQFPSPIYLHACSKHVKAASKDWMGRSFCLTRHRWGCTVGGVLTTNLVAITNLFGRFFDMDSKVLALLEANLFTWSSEKCLPNLFYRFVYVLQLDHNTFSAATGILTGASSGDACRCS